MLLPQHLEPRDTVLCSARQELSLVIVVEGFVLHPSGQEAAVAAFKFITLQRDSWRRWH